MNKSKKPVNTETIHFRCWEVFFLKKLYGKLSNQKYRFSVFCVLLAFASYTWFLPQTAFRDCVRPAEPQTAEIQTVLSETSAPHPNVHEISEKDWITLFRLEESPFEIVWKFGT